LSVRVSVPAIRNQTGRQFNVDKVDGVSRRHSPSLSLPAGSAVMDYPSRFVGRAFDEPTLLRMGHAYQQATDWHLRRPVLGPSQ
jgi:hypothetical protein